MDEEKFLKWLLVGLVVTVVLLVTITIASKVFGNDWEVTKKELKTNYVDVDRHVRVWDSFTGETIWKYSGFVYVTDDSRPGNITVIYRDARGKIRKNDFIGQHLNMSLFEITGLENTKNDDTEEYR